MACKAKGLNPRTMNINQIIENGMDAVFNFEWDYFYKAKQKQFQQQFLRHYFMYEIGSETPALFRMELQDSLELIMPYYNKMMESETLEFDRISTHDFHRTIDDLETQLNSQDEGITENTETNSDVGTSSFTKHADTPQNVVNSILTHLSSADQSTGDTNTTADTDYKHDRELTENKHRTYHHTFEETGYAGKDPNELLTSYRSTILNINRMIIEDAEIAKCFMGIWG